MRNQRNPSIADYYLSCGHTQPAFNQGIYMQYYQENLARKSHLYQKRELLRISRQILQGVLFLWQNRLLHRDLK
jgi:serine/threonine protein kinase